MKFSKDHEWVDIIEGSVARVGITNYAQHNLGDIVFVDLPELKSILNVGDPFAVVESVKAASDVYSPVSGTVLEINQAVTADPSIVNSQPETDGWLITVDMSDLNEYDTLMTFEEYQQFTND